MSATPTLTPEPTPVWCVGADASQLPFLQHGARHPRKVSVHKGEVTRFANPSIEGRVEGAINLPGNRCKRLAAMGRVQANINRQWKSSLWVK